MGFKLSDFSFEALGKSMDKDIREFKQALGVIKPISASEKKEVSMGDVVRELLKRAGQDVIIQSIGGDFEYNDLINWVRENAVGNKLYIVKGKLENSSDGVLCVFFAKDDTLLTSETYPKVCYIFKELNPTLDDLFANGKNIFIKPIKIV
ncbi:hypothetical protein [Segatella hominis]|jgi:hypothetical protein|uniref:hypothetical protein n=1 Tax=Segatella hominis TaxID=2518605 RepID=UPI0021C5BF9B|nr:hypothetical protein [Segatella hominis]